MHWVDIVIFGIPLCYAVVFVGAVMVAIAGKIRQRKVDAEILELKRQRDNLVEERKKNLAERLKAVNPDV
jgi:hypothetical protein